MKLIFIPVFLVNALETGKTIVWDYINEANATVGGPLNWLLDKKIKCGRIFWFVWKYWEF